MQRPAVSIFAIVYQRLVPRRPCASSLEQSSMIARGVDPGSPATA